MFVFLLALGEDYNILVMTRIREEAGRMPAAAGGDRALERTGSTVTSAGLVLAGTFGVFALVVGRTARRQRLPGHPRLSRDRHPDGHVLRPHPARPVHGRAARPLELVAVQARPARRSHSRPGTAPGP